MDDSDSLTVVVHPLFVIEKRIRRPDCGWHGLLPGRRRHPEQHVFMRNDLRATTLCVRNRARHVATDHSGPCDTKRGIASRVIAVVVRIDDVANRFIADRTQRTNDLV
jgi:hypothetical protein